MSVGGDLVTIMGSNQCKHRADGSTQPLRRTFGETRNHYATATLRVSDGQMRQSELTQFDVLSPCPRPWSRSTRPFSLGPIPPPIVHEIIAVSDRGCCELDLWLRVNGLTGHYSTKHLNRGQLESAVLKIANQLFRDVVGELQAAHRYIFNLTPNYMLVRQFE